jgi:hypothetical protein
MASAYFNFAARCHPFSLFPLPFLYPPFYVRWPHRIHRKERRGEGGRLGGMGNVEIGKGHDGKVGERGFEECQV